MESGVLDCSCIGEVFDILFNNMMKTSAIPENMKALLIQGVTMMYDCAKQSDEECPSGNNTGKYK